MIKELYLKKAANIRKDYIQLVSDISVYENLIKDFAFILETRAKDSQQITDDFKSGKIKGV